MLRDSPGAPTAVVEFPEGDPGGLQQLAAEHPAEITVIKAKGFGAFDFTTQALVVLVPTVVIQIGGIVKAYIESGRQVRIKVDGVEVDAPTADKAIELLQQIRDERGSSDRPD